LNIISPLPGGTRIFTLAPSIHIVLDVTAGRFANKRHENGKKVKLSPHAGDMMLYTQNPKEFKRKPISTN
jgi:hypothetical protein